MPPEGPGNNQNHQSLLRYYRTDWSSGSLPRLSVRAMADVFPTPGPRELPHLATFARAAERGSFTDAAVDLGVTQAAVSQRIAALEKELKVSLFNRRAGRITLTEAGERLYELTRRILGLHEEARESLGGSR